MFRSFVYMSISLDFTKIHLINFVVLRKKSKFVGKFFVMTDNDKTLTLFTTRIRQMILQYNQLKKENDKLYARLVMQENEIKSLRQSLDQAHKDSESLKMAKMIEIYDKDIDTAKRRVAGLIRDVNKCITLLSEK